MAVTAIPLDGWREVVPEVDGNAESEDPVRCQVRPLTSELEALVGTGVKVDREWQRAVLFDCVRQVTNYTGTNGRPITTPYELIQFGGRQAARYIAWLVNHIAGLSWTRDDLGESGGRPASS